MGEQAQSSDYELSFDDLNFDSLEIRDQYPFMQPGYFDFLDHITGSGHPDVQNVEGASPAPRKEDLSPVSSVACPDVNEVELPSHAPADDGAAVVDSPKEVLVSTDPHVVMNGVGNAVLTVSSDPQMMVNGLDDAILTSSADPQIMMNNTVWPVLTGPQTVINDVQPASTNPQIVRINAVQAVSTDPQIVKINDVQPVSTNPQILMNNAVQPVLTDPQIVRINAVQPVLTDPQIVRINAVQPALTDPQIVRVNAVKPTTDPQIVRINAVEPVTTDPQTVRSNAVQPVTDSEIVMNDAVQPETDHQIVMNDAVQPVTDPQMVMNDAVQPVTDPQMVNDAVQPVTDSEIMMNISVQPVTVPQIMNSSEKPITASQIVRNNAVQPETDPQIVMNNVVQPETDPQIVMNNVVQPETDPQIVMNGMNNAIQPISTDFQMLMNNDIQPLPADFQMGVNNDIQPLPADSQMGVNNDIQPLPTDSQIVVNGVNNAIQPTSTDFQMGLNNDVQPITDPQIVMNNDVQPVPTDPYIVMNNAVQPIALYPHIVMNNAIQQVSPDSQILVNGVNNAVQPVSTDLQRVVNNDIQPFSTDYQIVVNGLNNAIQPTSTDFQMGVNNDVQPVLTDLQMAVNRPVPTFSCCCQKLQISNYKLKKEKEEISNQCDEIQVKLFQALKNSIKQHDKDKKKKDFEIEINNLKEKNDMVQAELTQYKAMVQQNNVASSSYQHVQEQLKKSRMEVDRMRKLNAVLRKNQPAKPRRSKAETEMLTWEERVQAIMQQNELSELERDEVMDLFLMLKSQISSLRKKNSELTQKGVITTAPIINANSSPQPASYSSSCEKVDVIRSPVVSSEKLMPQVQCGKKRKSNEIDGETVRENLSSCKKINPSDRSPSLSDEQPSSTCMENIPCVSNASSPVHVQSKRKDEDIDIDMVSFRAEFAYLQNLCSLRLSPLHSPPHLQEDDASSKSSSMPKYDECLLDSQDVSAKLTSEPYWNVKEERLKQNNHLKFQRTRTRVKLAGNQFASAFKNLEGMGTKLLFIRRYSQNLVNGLVTPTAAEDVNSTVAIFLDRITMLTRKYSASQSPNDETLHLAEKCIATAIVQADRQQRPHLKDLVTLFLQEASERILRDSLRETETASSLCRVFTLICKVNNNIKHPKFLCQKLVEHCPTVSRLLIRIMVGVWNVLYDIPEAALIAVDAAPHSAKIGSPSVKLPKPQIKSNEQSKDVSLVYKKDILKACLDVTSSDVQENLSSVNICSNSETSGSLPVLRSKSVIVKQHELPNDRNLVTHTNVPNESANCLPRNDIATLDPKSSLNPSGSLLPGSSRSGFLPRPNKTSTTSKFHVVDPKPQGLSENSNAETYPPPRQENSSCDIPSNSNVPKQHIASSPSEAESSQVRVELPDSSGISEVLPVTECPLPMEEESIVEVLPSSQSEPHPVSESSANSEVSIMTLPDVPKRKKRKKRNNNRQRKRKAKQPKKQFSNPLDCALDNLDQLKFNKNLFKGFCHTLVNVLINPSVVESAQSAANSLIGYLVLSKRNPLMSYVCDGDPDTLIPLLELCLVEAIGQAEKKDKINLNGLVETLIARLNVEILQNKALATPAASALTRVYTLICRSRKILERPRVLYRKILQFRPDMFHMLFAAIISVWGEVLPPASVFSNSEVVKRVRQCILMRKPRNMTDATWRQCQMVFQNLCGLSESLPEDPSLLVADVAEIMLETQCADFELREYERLLELLVVQYGWAWSKTQMLDAVIFKALRPLFARGQPSIHIPAASVFIRLIGLIDQLSPGNDDSCKLFITNNLSDYFDSWDEDYLPICEAVHFCLLQIYINHEQQVPVWLSNWFDNHRPQFSKDFMSWIEALNR